MSTYGVGDVIQRLALDHSPPSYFLLLRLWIVVVGDSVIALRSLSVFWYFVSLFFTYLFMRDVDSLDDSVRGSSLRSLAAVSASGAVACVLVATNVMQLSLATEVRMYSQFVALGMLSSWLFVRSLQDTARPIHVVLYALASTGMLYTHNFGLFSLVAQVIAGWVVILERAEWRWNIAAKSSAWRNLSLAWGVTAALYAPWVPALIGQWQRFQEGFWIEPFSFDALVGASYKLFVVPRDSAWIQSDVAIGIAVAIAVLLSLSLWRPRTADIVVWLLTVVPLTLAIAVSAAGESLMRPRYLALAQVFLLCAVTRLFLRLRAGWVRRAAIVGFCGVQLAAALLFHLEHDVGNASDGVDGIVHVLRRNARPGESVLFSTPFTFVPAIYYGGRPRNWLFCPSDVTRVPAFFGTSVLTPEMICDEDMRRQIARTSSTVWLVEQDDGKLTLPFHWRRKQTFVVRDDYIIQRRLLVSRCEIAPAYLAD